VLVGARPWQLHEFPADHTCPNLDNSRPLQLLPVNGSTPTWSPSPKDLSTNTNSLVNLSLVSVAKDWSTTVVDTFPVPFRVVHDASCNAQPTLTLGLNTNVGRLTAEELVVAGTAIGGPSTPTWISLVSVLGSGVSSGSFIPYYALVDGFVHLTGRIYSSAFTFGATLFTLPKGYRPPNYVAATVWSLQPTQVSVLYIEPSGVAAIQDSNFVAANYIWLDNIQFLQGN